MADHTALIQRFRGSALKLVTFMQTSQFMSTKYGMAYLDQCLADDIAEELRLRDASDDALAELTAVLLEEVEIPYRDGYWRLNALGFPWFYPGPVMEEVA